MTIKFNQKKKKKITVKCKILEVWFKMAEWKDMHSSSLATTSKSQVAVEKSSEEDAGIYQKKIPHVQRQRRSHSETTGWSQSR